MNCHGCKHLDEVRKGPRGSGYCCEGLYKKHYIGLSDNVTYVVEDLEVDNVDQYSYTLNFNPKMWIPVTPGYVD